MDVKFLKNVVYKGRCSNAFKLGMIFASGKGWMKPAGCHVVYRGEDGVMDYSTIQAVMNVDAADVTIAVQDLPAETSWHYVRRQVSDCGLESANSPICVVEIDAEGEMELPIPNSPSELKIAKAAGGKLLLTWRYIRINEAISPVGFNVYQDSGEGFDYELPAATVRYTRASDYKWISPELTDGQLYKYVVRAFASAEEVNTVTVQENADAQGPVLIDDITVTIEDV